MSAQAQVSIDLEKIIIRGGNHPKPADGAAPEEVQACVMEMVCWLANEPWSDRPKCACPVITAAMIRVNDAIHDDARRSRLMRPLIPVVMNTRSTKAVEKRRAYFAADFAVRTRLPKLLRKLGREADALKVEALSPIVNAKTARASRTVTDPLRSEFWSSWYGRREAIKAKVKAKLLELTPAVADAVAVAVAVADADKNALTRILKEYKKAGYWAARNLAAEIFTPIVRERFADFAAESEADFQALIRGMAAITESAGG